MQTTKEQTCSQQTNGLGMQTVAGSEDHMEVKKLELGAPSLLEVKTWSSRVWDVHDPTGGD